jgi:2-amino-4-hydroxy-6-hydroxymethyldihydropteridine diphosphokinase
MAHALIGIGSNLGDRRENIRAALDLLTHAPGVAGVRNSRLYSSKPVGGPHGQGDYVNAAAAFQTSLAPHALLGALRQIEAQLGRTRIQRWAPRTIDLDLLLFEEEVLEDDELTLPHPRMSFRRFVLTPAAEIAPGMVHPVTGCRIDELLLRIDRGPHYVAIGGGYSYICQSQAWLAERLNHIMDCPLFLLHALALPDFAYASTSSLSDDIVEFYKCWAGALSRERWAASPQLQPLLEGAAISTIDGLPLPPAVSDFWFEEWRFHACLNGLQKNGNRLATREDHRLLEELKELSQTIVSPKLVIWVDTLPENSVDAESRWSTCLAETFRLSPCGPLLRIAGDDRDRMLAESIAAIHAMQPLEGAVS